MEKEMIPTLLENGIDIQLMKGAGYSSKAIRYCEEQPNSGSLEDADQVTKITGPCGDSITVYLQVNEGRITQAKANVTGCPGAIASAMAAMDLAQGKTLSQALLIGEKEIFLALGDLPDEKQDCIQLTAKVLRKSIEDYVVGGPRNMKSLS